jgi:predicted nucleotidyltransferase
MQYVGLDQIIENVLDKLGNVDEVYLTGDLALGKNNPFVDLVIVGDVDKSYLYQLIEKAETLIDKKIRAAIYQPEEFTEKMLKDIGVFMKLIG